jgi:hypothetical protein
MKLGFQEQNNGNGKLVLTADNLKFACQELGISDDAHTLRRAARAFDLYHSGKVEHVTDHTFRVASQKNKHEHYEVRIKQTPYLVYSECGCQDWMNYSGDQDLPDVNFWCKHSIAVLVWLHNNNGNSKCVVNECGTERAKALQDKLNGQLNSREYNGNGAENKAPSLNLSDPFQEAEQLDIDQIEGRRNGEQAWKLRNGDYCISYAGVMTLAEKHSIKFDELSVNDDTVIAKAKNGNERVSGKVIFDNANTAIELAKRNAARQLLPLPEIKAVEHKAKLESEFSWEKAKAKCLELVNDANLSIIIHDLTQAGKLRQDNPSHYDRTEWLIIYNACKQDVNDDGDNTSSSNDDGFNPNWREWYDKCVKVSSIAETDVALKQVMNDHNARYRKDLIGDADWQKVFEIAKELRETYNRVQATKSERAFLTKQYEYDYIQAKTGFNVRRKQIEKIFGRSNGATKKLSKLYDEKPLEFEIDTTKPNVVKLIFSNGTVATIYDQVIYEAVLRA